LRQKLKLIVSKDGDVEIMFPETGDKVFDIISLVLGC
jgi:hypothetical protein